jgi:hypothetical protein
MNVDGTQSPTNWLMETEDMRSDNDIKRHARELE